MAKKDGFLQCTCSGWLKDFYTKLGQAEDSESSWVRYALIDFAKRHELNSQKALERRYLRPHGE